MRKSLRCSHCGARLRRDDAIHNPFPWIAATVWVCPACGPKGDRSDAHPESQKAKENRT